MSVPCLRVPHGRGRLYGDAEANRGTFIDRTSSASGSAKLRDCRLLHGSSAEDRVQVYGGEFYGTLIKGDTIVAGNPEVHGSVLWCSEISGSPYLRWVRAIGNTEICDSPRLSGLPTEPNLELRNAIIYGSPTIEGSFKVTGRVHEGTWTRAPKHIKLPWVDLSECVDGKILLNCYCRKVEWFLRFGHRLAGKWSWSADMVDVTMETIRREFT